MSLGMELFMDFLGLSECTLVEAVISGHRHGRTQCQLKGTYAFQVVLFEDSGDFTDCVLLVGS